MTPKSHTESLEVLDPSTGSFCLNITDHKHSNNTYLTTNRRTQPDRGIEETINFGDHNFGIMNSNYDDEFSSTLDHATASLLQTKGESNTHNSTPEYLSSNEQQQIQQQFQQQHHNMQYTFGQMNDVDEIEMGSTQQIHSYTQDFSQPQNAYVLPAQQHQIDQFASPANISRSHSSKDSNYQMHYQQKSNPFYNKVTKPQHNRYVSSSTAPNFQIIDDSRFSSTLDNLPISRTFSNKEHANVAEKQFTEIISQNFPKEVSQRNPYSYQNVGAADNTNFDYKFQPPAGSTNSKIFEDIAFLNSLHYGMLDNKANSISNANLKQKDSFTSSTDIDMESASFDFNSAQLGNSSTVHIDEGVTYNIPFPVMQQNKPSFVIAPEMRNSFSSISQQRLDNYNEQVNPIYDPEKFRGRSYDFKIIETSGDSYSGQSSNRQKHLTSSSHDQTEDYLESLKLFIGHDSLESDIKYVISRLNSTQLQKFSESKYSTVSGETNLAEQTLENVISGAKGNDMRAIKEDLFETWNATKSSLTIYYCSCKRFVWRDLSPTHCPFDMKRPDKQVTDSSAFKSLERSQGAAHSPVSLSHSKIPFCIELFNNHILSILLNKKLRTYLKKTIRPSKMLKEKCRYINLLQDGKIYKDTIEEDIDKIDFAFTLTMCTPKIPGIGSQSKDINAVYFIFNELPPYLRYKPEFMFLACAFDANDKLEWNRELLTPLFAYLNFLKDNTIRVSLNRHEYHVKIAMTMALANDQAEAGTLLDVTPSNPNHQCAYCTAPSCIIRDNLGNEYQTIYSSKEYHNVQFDSNRSHQNEDSVSINQTNYGWLLRESFILEPLKYFDYNRCLLIDAEKWIMNGLFQHSIAGLVKHLLKFDSSDLLNDLYRQNLVRTHESLLKNNTLKNPQVLLQLIDPQFKDDGFDIPMSDIKVLQSIFPHLFHVYFSGMYESPNKIRQVLPKKMKILALLIELNSYISALFSSEVARDKIPSLRESLRDLLIEIEHLSKYEMFKDLNMVLLLPLHYMFHLYEKWEDVGDYTAISASYLEETLCNFRKMSENNSISESVLQDRIKCLNIHNCMKIHRYAVEEYPAFRFIDGEIMDKGSLPARSKIKCDEFIKKFLFDAVDSNTFEQCSVVENITSFELNSIVITPEAKSSTSNLVRTKGTKRSAGWRLIHIYGMKRVTFTDPFTREKVKKVFIEYKETRSKKKYQKASERRPAFLLGELLMLKSSGKDLRCVWLDDINMVALKVLTESHLVYDPHTLLQRVFDV